MINDYFNKAMLAFDKKEYSNAIAYFLQCKLDVNQAYSLYLGKAYFLNDQVYEAIACLNSYLENADKTHSQAQMADAWDTLGQCYAALKNNKQAIVCFKNAQTASAFHNMALVYMNLAATAKSPDSCFQSLSSALNFLETALKQTEDNPMFFHSLASWYEQYMQALEDYSQEKEEPIEQIHGAYHKAMENYLKALSLTKDPVFKNVVAGNFTECMAQYGHFLYRNKKYQEAQVYYLQVIKADPLHTSALNQMGMALFKLGEFDQARTYFKQLLLIPASSSQDVADAWLNIACTYRLEKNLDEAKKALDEALRLAPKDNAIIEEQEKFKLEVSKAALHTSPFTSFVVQPQQPPVEEHASLPSLTAKILTLE